MLWANIGIIVLVLILASIYFLPYRKLKGKVFKKLLPDPSGITAMEYRTAAYSLQLEKRNGIWYIIDSDWEADKSRVTKLLNRLRDLNVDERITGSQDDPEFNIGSNGYLILDYEGKITNIAIGNRVEHDEDYVYITKSGKVYHCDRKCTYLKPDVREIQGKDVPLKRNSSGGKYKPCEKCCQDIEAEQLARAYITTYGDRYHKTSVCPKIKRDIRRVKKSETNKLPACSKCGAD